MHLTELNRYMDHVLPNRGEDLFGVERQLAWVAQTVENEHKRGEQTPNFDCNDVLSIESTGAPSCRGRTPAHAEGS